MTHWASCFLCRNNGHLPLHCVPWFERQEGHKKLDLKMSIAANVDIGHESFVLICYC